MTRRLLPVAAVLLCAVHARVCAQATGSVPYCAREPLHMIVLGDSLAHGTGANSPRGGFAYRIYDRLAASHRGSSFDDLSIPGATTRDVLVKEVPLLRATSCSLLLLAVGANDIQRYSSPKHFAHDYAALLDALRKKFPSSPLIATGIPDMSVTRTVPFFARPLVSALSAIDNAVVLQTAAAKNAYVVDLYALSKGAEVHRPGFFSRDGLHPSDAGHHTLSDFAFPVVERALRRR